MKTTPTSQTHLIKEGLVFTNREVDGEQPWRERGAECIAIHECYLGGHRLVFQQMFPGRDHVCQDLPMRLHNGRYRPPCQFAEFL